jgi:hypothetical protein
VLNAFFKLFTAEFNSMKNRNANIVEELYCITGFMFACDVSLAGLFCVGRQITIFNDLYSLE